LAVRQKWLSLISVLGILCGLDVLNNNVGFHAGNSNVTKPPGENNVRVMTITYMILKKFGSRKDISTKHEILEIINRQQPDIIGIQEFYTRKRGEYDMVDSIKKNSWRQLLF